MINKKAIPGDSPLSILLFNLNISKCNRTILQSYLLIKAPATPQVSDSNDYECNANSHNSEDELDVKLEMEEPDDNGSSMGDGINTSGTAFTNVNKYEETEMLSVDDEDNITGIDPITDPVETDDKEKEGGDPEGQGGNGGAQH